MSRPFRFAPRPRPSGFTLIELLVTVAIVAVLGSLAYPSFMDSVRKSRRAEAVEMMTRIQQAQERWRANRSSYTTDLSSAGLNVSSSAAAVVTKEGYYSISVTVPPAQSGSSYTITAAAQGSQAADTNCASMSMTMANGTLTYGATGGERCWAK